MWAARRDWDAPTLVAKDVYERVMSYYTDKILPELRAGKNILLVAHGNSIRTVIKHIEDISNEGIDKTEMLVDLIADYGLNSDGPVKDKHIHSIDITPPNA